MKSVFLVLAVTVAISFFSEVSPQRAGCQDGWDRYGSSCFRAFNIPGTWSQAKAACQSENGNLASILDSTTNNGVAFLVGSIPNNDRYTDRMWIGLSRPSRGSAWEWVDNTPLNYEAWGQGSPSGDGDCAEIVTQRNSDGGNDCYGWNDLDCNANRQAFVCEKPANA